MKDEVEELFLAKLKPLVDDLYGTILYGYPKGDNEEMFNVIKEISAIFDEIIKIDSNRKEFESLLRDSIVGGDQYECKREMFRLIRHILVHFPVFNKWDDVFINRKIVRWNNNMYGGIEKFFDKYGGSKIDFSIYTKKDYFYDKTKSFSIKIPSLKDSEPVYLKDMISFEDVLWLFILVGYYLEWKHWIVSPIESKYAGMISA